MPSTAGTSNWQISLRCFILGTFSLWVRLAAFILKIEFDLSLPFLWKATDQPVQKLNPNWISILTTDSIIGTIVLLIVKVTVRPRKYGVAWRALLLGSIFQIGFSLAHLSSNWKTLGLYLMALAVFHWSEYMVQTIFNPQSTTVDSYMLYHSNAYVAAAVASFIEYHTEMYFWPRMKLFGPLNAVGMIMVMGGDTVRKVAMWTAKSNFNHYVRYAKVEGHELVTSGIYSLFRHPSYVGWFWWSIGTQFLLCNPICTVAYAIASWIFFNERIREEESTLISFFGERYLEYQKRVGTGLPFITGFECDDKYKTRE